ncbi:MAG TPA: hypothetical protein PKX17_05065, partial [Candidatus Methanomethylicus sp.]|nr:hypothetical protein [Candidatus Methanomethylicus sp.]
LQGTIDEMFPEKEPPAPEPTNVAGVPGTAAPEQPQVEEPETEGQGITQAEAVAMLEGAARILAGENGYHA